MPRLSEEQLHRLAAQCRMRADVVPDAGAAALLLDMARNYEGLAAMMEAERAGPHQDDGLVNI